MKCNLGARTERSNPGLILVLLLEIINAGLNPPPRDDFPGQAALLGNGRKFQTKS